MTVKPIGFRELQRQLINVADRGNDPSPLLPELDEDFRQLMGSQFRSGRGWKPLSPEYAAQKAREGRSPLVGVYTGGLMNSLVRAGHPQHVSRFTRDKSFIVGSTNQVQRLFTGKHKTRNQPRRTIRIAPATRREWLQMVQDYIVEGKR